MGTHPIVDGHYLFRGPSLDHPRLAAIKDGLVHAVWLSEPVPADTLNGKWLGPLSLSDPRVQRAAEDPMGRVLPR